MLGSIHQHRQPSPRIFPDVVGLSRAWRILRGAGCRSYAVSRGEGYRSTEFGKIRIRALCYSKCSLPSPDCWSPLDCVRREFSYTTKWDYWCYWCYWCCWWHQCSFLLVWRVYCFCKGTFCKERNKYLTFSHYSIYSGRSVICPVNIEYIIIPAMVSMFPIFHSVAILLQQCSDTGMGPGGAVSSSE